MAMPVNIKTSILTSVCLLAAFSDALAYCIEREIEVKEVPTAVLTAASMAVAGIEFEEASLIGQAEETAYELEGESNGREYEILVSPAGEVLQTKEEND